MVWDLSLSSPRRETTNHAMCCLGHPTRDLGNQKSDSYPVVELSRYVTGVFEGGSIQPVTVVLRRRIRLHTIAAKTASTTEHWAISLRTLQLAPQLWRTRSTTHAAETVMVAVWPAKHAE